VEGGAAGDGVAVAVGGGSACAVEAGETGNETSEANGKALSAWQATIPREKITNHLRIA